MQEIIDYHNFFIKKNISEFDLTETGKKMIKHHKKKGLKNEKHKYEYTIYYNNIYIGGIDGFVEYNTMKIENLYIQKEFRNNKLGTKLINLIKEHGKFFQCKNCFIEILDIDLSDFFSKLGFNIIFQMNNYPQGRIRYFMQMKLY